MQSAKDDRSLGDLFAELSRQTSTLVRQEINLAKAEITQRATKVGKDVGSIAVGGAVVYAGFLAVEAAIIVLLAKIIDWWLAALIVGVGVGLIGYMLVQRGRTALKQADLAPRQTIETLKEDVEWAKQQTN
jgi:Putative Actinobacterial Holin-X, holin superfamily III